MRILFAGIIARYPFGGVTWCSLMYLLGLRALGHEVFYIEDTGECVYDPVQNKIGTSVDKGTVFRVVKFDPGVAPRNHRTDSIDYGIVLSGEIDMELDNGKVVHLKAGDCVVQRGTIHNWVNPGKEPCLVAFILIWAKPVEINGKRFDAHG